MSEIAKNKIIAKLESLGNEYTIIGNEIKTTCLNPEHNDNNPSYFINTDSLVSHCFSCGYSPHPKVLFDMDDEDVDELIRRAKYANLSKQFHKEDTEEIIFKLPPKAYDIDRDWRGISIDLLRKLGVYYCDTGRYAGRLIFPIYENETLLGWDARIVNMNIVPEELKDVKWLRPKGMLASAIVYPYNYLKNLPSDKRSHVILTEGVADALSYLEIGIAATPTFGVAPPDMKRIETLLSLGVDKISIGYDNDEAGSKARIKVYPYYIKWFKIAWSHILSKIAKSGAKDANEALINNIIRKGDK